MDVYRIYTYGIKNKINFIYQDHLKSLTGSEIAPRQLQLTLQIAGQFYA